MLFVFTYDFLSNSDYFLEIEVHFRFGRFDPHARVCCKTIVLYLTCFNHFLHELECFRQPIEEHIICVKWALSFIWVVQVHDIKAFEIESLQTIFKLLFEEFRVQAVT